MKRATVLPWLSSLIHRFSRRAAGSAAILSMMLVLQGMAPGMASAKTYRVAITGDSDTRFAGRCTIARDGSEEIIELEGDVPFERAFTGEGIACSFEAQGRLAVEIIHDGGRSRAATSGGAISIAAR